MARFYLIGFTVLLIFDTIAQCSFKLAAIHAEPLAMSIDWLVRVFTNPWIYISIAGYIFTFFTWMTLLKKAPVGPAFAASHFEVVTVMIASIWLFNEPITLFKLIGTILIVSGIVFLAIAENKLTQQNNH
ncbi:MULTISPECIES: DMT family transporter [unclassified Gilliamella]|uniref:DMT family transporter n=1 Tax=unclassified Gilliamella TaxID=2685620 RepID=UPI00080D9FE4|nr:MULTISPECIES: EamA family transporter [Gilliamella]MCX8640906.1 EamA family transporter [Gilliamella sp. B3835]MCX8707845.1 EamA family transporter [Gilliamella sp. B3783]MCX8710318.1 EamA family transporter [Gilliamella sp. B3780]MCX8712536.1 EamA family transporter [Gilliamella sp. B3468]MCX8714825.1 EamA family transporter [Gilliamella sp. B3781]